METADLIVLPELELQLDSMFKSFEPTTHI